MSKLTLIFAGLFIASAFGHPAAEDVHHVEEEKKHHENVEDLHEHEGRHSQGNAEINIQETKFLHPAVKCAEIVPDVGEAGPENHQACLAHCVQLEKEYRHGRCLKGICHCGVEIKEAAESEAFHQKNAKGHPTARCEHIIPTIGAAGPANHEACRAHCSSLDREFIRGECFEGICHCGRGETIPISNPTAHATEKVHKSIQSEIQKPAEGVHRHPTVKCEHLVPLKGTPSAENHELCHVHCRSLGSEYLHGECSQGVCHCQHRAREESGNPTVRCEHIHPITGHPGPENHEACSSHCRYIAEFYLEGKCVAGICKCKPGTLVKAVVPNVHSPSQSVQFTG